MFGVAAITKAAINIDYVADGCLEREGRPWHKSSCVLVIVVIIIIIGFPRIDTTHNPNIHASSVHTHEHPDKLYEKSIFSSYDSPRFWPYFFSRHLVGSQTTGENIRARKTVYPPCDFSNDPTYVEIIINTVIEIITYCSLLRSIQKHRK